MGLRCAPETLRRAAVLINDRVGPVLLGGYAAKQCPVRTQNDHLPIATKWEPSPEDQARLDAGIAFEQQVFDQIRALNPDAVLIYPHLRRGEAIEATMEAIRAGAPLILGGWLPDDPAGGRKGRPDILVAVEGGYLPADVKHHRSAEPKARKAVQVSPLHAPASWSALPGWSAATIYRYSDGLQLAHYGRLLAACNAHPGEHLPWGAILGSTRLPAGGQPDALAFVWHDLTEPLGYTFSRSSATGKKRRSLLERYDHEHRFRVKVATAARHANATGDMTNLLVEPVGQAECRKCPYEQVCAEQMGPDDPSHQITVAGLDTREWLTLRRLGIRTTADLAALDLDDEPGFLDDYYREVTHRGRDTARARLAATIQRAQMIRDGVHIIPAGAGPIEVPAADVEIDLDIEWDSADLTYMWGARIRAGRDETTSDYVAFVDWSADFDPAGEHELAARFAEWLREQIRAAEQAGKTVRVFHWSSPEPSRLRRILGAPATADLLDPDIGVFTDLESVFKSRFVSLHGSSIKKVAPHFGFSWSVDDPGGAISQRYLNTLRAEGPAAEPAKRWLLSYNADDCEAMTVIRDGMRSWADVGGDAGLSDDQPGDRAAARQDPTLALSSSPNSATRASAPVLS